MAEEQSLRKRVRVDSQDPESPASKRIREDLLVLLDDSDTVSSGCRDSDIPDLDSVMRSFEQELSGAPKVASPAVVDLTTDSGDSLPELGYLLGASDDELGLPSAIATELKQDDLVAEFNRVSSESSGLNELWPSFEEGLPSYGDSFGLGIGEQPYDHNGNDYVALDGIFDYSDVNFGPSDYSDLTWRPETLPAL